MALLDYLVFSGYIIGIVAVGLLYTCRMKDSKEMFAAGGRSPWWVSGLSGFMTMFSAGTFVVWGGIAYRFGLGAVSISMCYGVAAIMVGWWLAGRWKRMGVTSAPEYLQVRFGKSIVQFYTWLQGGFNVFTTGGTVYALAVIVCALMPLSKSNPLADPETGHLSVLYASLAICLIVTVITFSGGLWAVLITDVLQFVVLTVSVIFVVPLAFMKVGGIGSFVDTTPEGFFHPIASDFTWWFLAGWVAIHFFKIGGEWAFVQRYQCVPSPREARWSSYIFGVMYLLSPVFWMLPPMIYRTVNPDADYEQAYILACEWVLPPGMIGLMLAAMTSATASYATTQLNVYAGAFTTEFYQRILRPDASERRLVLVGRGITLLLGCLLIGGAVLIPRMGTYTGYIIAITALLTGPLVLPTIWGMFSRKIGLADAWAVTIVGFVGATVFKFGLLAGGWFADWRALKPLTDLVQINPRVSELAVGILPPLLLLSVIEVVRQRESPGWSRLVTYRKETTDEAPVVADTLPARLVAYTVGLIALAIAGITLVSPEDRGTLSLFTLVLFVITAVMLKRISYMASVRSRGIETRSMNDCRTPATGDPQ
ncbi:MAG: hypothetical protein R3C45_09135 [Phycisphaerales bacterium]